MPRIPVVQAQQDIPGSTRLPTPDAGALSAPSRALAHGAQVVGGATVQALQTYQRAQDELTEMDTKLDIAEKTSRFQFDVAAEEVRLRESGMEPDAYAAALERKVQEIRQTYAQALRYPGSAPRFQLATEPISRKAIIDGRYNALAMKDARVQVGVGEQLDGLAKQRVFGSPEERAQAETSKAALIDEMIRRKVWSGEQAAAARNKWDKDVALGEVERRFMVPEERAGLVRDLYTGSVKGLSAAEGMAKGNELIGRHVAERNALRAEAKERWKVDQETAERRLHNEAADGTLTVDRLRAEADYWQFSTETVRRIEADMQRDPEKEKASDPQTYQWMLRNVYSAVPRVSEAQIHQARDNYINSGGAFGLNSKDYKDALNTLRSTNASLRAEGRTVQNQQQSQAEQQLKAALGIPDIVSENIDPVRSRLYDQGLRELTNRTAIGGGKESPIEVVRDIIPRLQSELSGNARLKTSEARAVTTFPDARALEQARQSGAVSPAEYRRQRDAFLQIFDAEMQRQAMQIEGQVRQTPAAPASSWWWPFGSSGSAKPETGQPQPPSGRRQRRGAEEK